MLTPPCLLRGNPRQLLAGIALARVINAHTIPCANDTRGERLLRWEPRAAEGSQPCRHTGSRSPALTFPGHLLGQGFGSSRRYGEQVLQLK